MRMSMYVTAGEPIRRPVPDDLVVLVPTAMSLGRLNEWLDQVRPLVPPERYITLELRVDSDVARAGGIGESGGG